MLPLPIFSHLDADGTCTEVDRMPTGEILLSVRGPDVGDIAHRIVVPVAAWEAMRAERLVSRVVLIGDRAPMRENADAA